MQTENLGFRICIYVEDKDNFCNIDLFGSRVCIHYKEAFEWQLVSSQDRIEIHRNAISPYESCVVKEIGHINILEDQDAAVEIEFKKYPMKEGRYRILAIKDTNDNVVSILIC